MSVRYMIAIVAIVEDDVEKISTKQKEGNETDGVRR